MGRCWVVVLAGGDGRRLEEVVARHHGRPRPAPFCDFGTGRTLLSRTLDRAERLTVAARTVVVTNRAHRDEVEAAAALHPRVEWLEEPRNRGTTPAIALAVLWILERDPTARVVVLPSDHDVADADAFVARVDEAVASLDDDPHPALVLGASPEGPVADDGWIVPVDWNGERWPRVLDFCERPSPARVASLRQRGACLNTFVLVAEAWTLALLVRRHVPAWFRALAGRDAIRMETAYHTLPASGFSEDVLAQAQDDLRLVPLGPVGWSDIGTPERLERAGWWAEREAM